MDLIHLGEFDQEAFNKYSKYDYIPEKDIIYYVHFSNDPILLVDAAKNINNIPNGIYDSITNLKFSPRLSAIPLISIVDKDGMKAFKLGSVGERNVFQAEYSTIPQNVKNAIKSGNLTVITFVALSASGSQRHGLSCFWNRTQLSSGWMTSNYNPWINVVNPGFNVCHFAFDGNESKTNMGMMAYCIARTSNIIRKPTKPGNNYNSPFSVDEVTYTGNLSTSANGFAGLDTSESMQLFKAQEKTYYMLSDVYFNALAIYNVGFSADMFRQILNLKTLRINYKNVNVFTRNIINLPEVTNFTAIDKKKELMILIGINDFNLSSNPEVSTIICCCDSNDNIVLNLSIIASTKSLLLQIFTEKETLTLQLDNTLSTVSTLTQIEYLNGKIFLRSMSSKEASTYIYDNLKANISRVYFQKHPLAPATQCSCDLMVQFYKCDKVTY